MKMDVAESVQDRDLPLLETFAEPSRRSRVLAIRRRLNEWFSQYKVALTIYFAVLVISGLGFIGKLPLLARVVPLPLLLLKVAICAAVLLPLAWKVALRFSRAMAVLVLAGLVIASLVVYPRMESLRSIGRGSDQPDCVIVAANNMAHAQWPYERKQMWSKDPMSCGPGWVAVQAPVTVAIGYRYNLLVLWAVALAVITNVIGWSRTQAALALMALTPSFWVSASDGTDFLPFGVLFAALLMAANRRGLKSPILFLAAGLISQFRFPTVFAPAFFFGRTTRFQKVAVVVFGVACELAFLAWRSDRYISDGPLHLFYKLTGSHIIAGNSWLAVAEIALLSAVMLGFAMFVQTYFQWEWTALLYLIVLFAIPSALDLRAKIHVQGSTLAGLGVWEGANWLSGCLPLCALMFLQSLETKTLPPVEDAGR